MRGSGGLAHVQTAVRTCLPPPLHPAVGAQLCGTGPRTHVSAVPRSVYGHSTTRPLPRTASAVRPILWNHCDRLTLNLIFPTHYSYDTFLRSDAEAAQKGLTPDQYYTSPNGFKFVKKTVSEGILPMIETELLAARKRAKKQMKEATNDMDRSVFDGKQ